MIGRRWSVAVAPLVLSGCAGFQNALGGQGAEDANFIRLFTLFMIVCAIMYALIVGGLMVALWRRRRGAATDKRDEDAALLRSALVAWTILVLAGLAGLTIASFFTDRSNAQIAQGRRLNLKVTANQWWWDVQYSSADSSKTVHTANEIHLPVGVPAEVTLESNDVIHSFWVPNLAGKQDLIPGRVTDVQLLARKTGLYRGQCAEFCGVQHAHMALDVTVEGKADFEHWLAAQQKPALAPVTPLEAAGYRYITTRECSSCHNIGGSPASGQVAPDLTHFASRRSIAAGTLPMNSGNVARWIADPQSQKPGNHMPTIPLAASDLHAVVAYLQRLK